MGDSLRSTQVKLIELCTFLTVGDVNDIFPVFQYILLIGLGFQQELEPSELVVGVDTAVPAHPGTSVYARIVRVVARTGSFDTSVDIVGSGLYIWNDKANPISRHIFRYAVIGRLYVVDHVGTVRSFRIVDSRPVSKGGTFRFEPEFRFAHHGRIAGITYSVSVAVHLIGVVGFRTVVRAIHHESFRRRARGDGIIGIAKSVVIEVGEEDREATFVRIVRITVLVVGHTIVIDVVIADISDAISVRVRHVVGSGFGTIIQAIIDVARGGSTVLDKYIGVTQAVVIRVGVPGREDLARVIE